MILMRQQIEVLFLAADIDAIDSGLGPFTGKLHINFHLVQSAAGIECHQFDFGILLQIDPQRHHAAD